MHTCTSYPTARHTDNYKMSAISDVVLINHIVLHCIKVEDLNCRL